MAYMTPNEIRTLDPNQISSMTMKTGATIYVNQSQTCSETVCDNCKMGNVQSQNYVLRAKKETTVQEGENGEKIEEKVEIDVQAQPEGENNDQVLRGPDGMPLLNDILTKDIYGEEGQNQEQQLVDENGNYEPQEQNNEQYNENEINQMQAGEEQYVQEQNEEMNYNENQEQYYPQDYNEVYNEDPNYYPPETQNDLNYPSDQNVEEQNVEQGYTDQYEPTEGQENVYPSLDDNENQQYQEPEYQPPMNVPQESQEKEIEPPVESYDQPPLQEPVQYPPTQQPNQLPIKPTVPKVAKDIKGYAPKNKGYQMKMGFGLPKKPFPPMGKGFPQPHGPQRPMGHPRFGPMMPHGPKMPLGPRYKPTTNRKMGPGGKVIVINPIGAMVNAVNKVMAPIAGMAVKGTKLRNTKPTTFNQDSQKLRARPNAYNSSYNKQGQTFSSKYTTQGYGYNYGNKKSQWSSQPNYGCQTYGKGNNYKFHEIVETSDNSKSYVVVKRGGETVSYDQ